MIHRFRAGLFAGRIQLYRAGHALGVFHRARTLVGVLAPVATEIERWSAFDLRTDCTQLTEYRFRKHWPSSDRERWSALSNTEPIKPMPHADQERRSALLLLSPPQLVPGPAPARDLLMPDAEQFLGFVGTQKAPTSAF
jgi:hypothetical protein